ncbi:hypothetical protein ASZ90_005451 [hydrocarbon metagenome]|uniref:Uncharacterized protein n=1 Tax=hydrocarbon metagenome TaxID=938273 RepID=A0A0W8FV70_9ZZZZ
MDSPESNDRTLARFPQIFYLIFTFDTASAGFVYQKYFEQST